ncbi:MAG TPA: FAD-dependent oxidoreductase, partial [Rudaea sp.]|nr:FAD-dependent oxidoreductase [Rudaea sp.]
GVTLVEWVQPRRILGSGGKVTGVEFEYTKLDADRRLVGTGERLIVPADFVLKAVGQALDARDHALKIEKGRVVVDADHATSLPGVWAGGDCIGSGVDLTVQAVEDGKRAARAIDRTLAAQTARRGQAHG